MLLKLTTPQSENASFKILLIRNSEDINHPLLEPLSNTLSRKLDEKNSGWITWYGKDETRIVAILKATENKTTFDLWEEARSKGGQAAKKINGEKAETCRIINLSESISHEEALAFTEGVCLGNYQYLNYRTKKKENTLSHLEVEQEGTTQEQLDEIRNLCTANFEARNLVNAPVLDMNSVDLSEYLKEQSKTFGFTVKVLEKPEIEQLGMGGLLGVNKGSSIPPTFNILEYKPQNTTDKAPVVLVGKGVMYDTGGYSIKPGASMSTMKCDMGGAAAVIGTIIALASNKTPIHVIGLVPSTDNRINSDALVPDDVITISDGTTVEVLNTDAEGRLILADALHYAKQYNPRLVIDLATLTGSAMAVTGNLGAALMGTDQDYRKDLIEAGDMTYERLGEIPFWKEFSEMLKGDIADLKNIGGPIGGAATAGKFLEHFTANEDPWLHLDIAGPAFLKEDQDYKQKGASGFGVRLLYTFLSRLSQ